VEPKKVVLIEGIMIFFEKDLRDLIDLKIYVDTPDDIRFIRRLQRDVQERGRTMESVITQYLDVVRPGHYGFIEPAKEYADIIIPEGGFNTNALKVLASFMNEILD
jgi:uridine kinase